MKKLLTASAAVVALLAVGATAWADTPPEVPFPAPKTDVFVAVNTSTTAGAATNFVTRGSSVVFSAFAADLKTRKVLTDKDVKYFYVAIPDQPNVKLTFSKLGSRFLWTATWTVPASQPLGIVPFKALVKTNARRYGSFVQPPVTNAMLTVTG
jgi:hypothetical protein